MNDNAHPEADAEIDTSLNEELADATRDELGDDQLIEFYRTMRLIRRFETTAGRSYQMKKIKGFCHLYSGQEAVAVGAMNAITDDDYIVSAYRDHGHAIARGLDPNRIMAELYAKKEGIVKGKGGSMHLFDVDKKFFGGWGIVGGQLPTATGVGFAIDYRSENAVCLCFMGDGTVHQGAFHETLNLASKMDLPVVYVIENNWYAMGTALDRISAVLELEKKAISYDMPGTSVEDGQDVFEVYQTLSEAVERAREQNRPTLIDVKTYRYSGHSMSDPATYRSKDEVERERQRDPVDRLGHWLIDEDICSREDLESIDEECKERVSEAKDFAEDADFPDSSALTEDVYVDYPGDIH